MRRAPVRGRHTGTHPAVRILVRPLKCAGGDVTSVVWRHGGAVAAGDEWALYSGVLEDRQRHGGRVGGDVVRRRTAHGVRRQTTKHAAVGACRRRRRRSRNDGVTWRHCCPVTLLLMLHGLFVRLRLGLTKPQITTSRSSLLMTRRSTCRVNRLHDVHPIGNHKNGDRILLRRYKPWPMENAGWDVPCGAR